MNQVFCLQCAAKRGGPSINRLHLVGSSGRPVLVMCMLWEQEGNSNLIAHIMIRMVEGILKRNIQLKVCYKGYNSVPPEPEASLSIRVKIPLIWMSTRVAALQT